MREKRKRGRTGSARKEQNRAEENKSITKRIEDRAEHLRKKYAEVHGKVVDFISHEVQDDTLYVNVWFLDRTRFSLRYSCDMVIVGAEFGEMKGGNPRIVREYMQPISRH